VCTPPERSASIRPAIPSQEPPERDAISQPVSPQRRTLGGRVRMEKTEFAPARTECCGEETDFFSGRIPQVQLAIS